jgi:hypothetical protein
MDFPPEWTILHAQEYETATPRITGDITLQICAQLRPSGRILDHFRVALGGTRILDYEAELSHLIPVNTFKGWRIKGQARLTDIAIRANVFSSAWIDLSTTVAMREMEIFDKDGAQIPAGEFLRILEDLDDDGPSAASYRFAVIIGEDAKPRLQLQSLPASAVLLAGKALLKG